MEIQLKPDIIKRGDRAINQLQDLDHTCFSFYCPNSERKEGRKEGREEGRQEKKRKKEKERKKI